MTLAILIAIAGGAGSSLRYLVDHVVTQLLAGRRTRSGPLPWATFLINTTGSFALGVITAAAASGTIGDQVRLVLAVGACGGYTTFSTAMVDTLRLGLQRRLTWAALNVIGTLVCATAAAGLGWALVT